MKQINQVKIAGIQKSTTLDYPWKLACVVFTQWCNFRCPFCHNPEMVLPEQMQLFQQDLISPEAVFNFLESRKWMLDWVSICGGEPTLQSWLYEFAKRIKDMWFLVKLDTNGRDAFVVERMIKDQILDYVAVDLKHTIYQYDQAVWVKQDSGFFRNYEKLLGILLNSNIDYEYRTTVIKGMHDEESIEYMAQYIRWAKNYYLQNYVAGNSIDPNFGGEAFSSDELELFKSIASKYVENVWIRI